MDRADRLGPARDPPQHVLGIDAEVVLAHDLGEHRLGAAVARRRGGGDERDARDDHLVAGADARGEVRKVQGRGAAAHRDRVRHAEVLGELGLELLRARPQREPSGAERVRHRRDDALVELHVEDGDPFGAHATFLP